MVGMDGSALYDPTADGSTWMTLPPPPIRIDFATVVFVWAGSDTPNQPFADGAVLNVPSTVVSPSG